MKATSPLALLLLLVTVLASAASVGRAAAEAGAEASGAKHAKSVTNGFLQPTRENKAWKYYE